MMHLLFPPVGLLPPPLPRSTFAEITTGRYYLPTSISLPINNALTRMIFQSPEHRIHHALYSRLLQQSTRFNMES
jgi:hypothetical protein